MAQCKDELVFALVGFCMRVMCGVHMLSFAVHAGGERGSVDARIVCAKRSLPFASQPAHPLRDLC